MKALQTKGAKFRVDTDIVIIRHVAIGILPYVNTTSLRLDANLATSAFFDVLRQMRSPAKSQRKVVRKDQLLYWRGLYNWIVCLKTLIRENLFYGKNENWDQITPKKSPEAPGTKFFGKKGKKGSTARNFSIVCASRASLRAWVWGGGALEETLHQERCARGVAWTWRKYLQAQECGESYGLSFCWTHANAGAHFKISRTSRIRSQFRSINPHAEQKKDLSSDELDTPGTPLWRSCHSTHSILSVQNKDFTGVGYESFSNRHSSRKEFTLIIPWNLRKSCEDPSCRHRTDPRQMALERAARSEKEGTSAVLLQSALDEKWSADSVECYCYLRNVQDLLADWITHHIPFGAMVEYHPISARHQSKFHQFGKKVLPGIILAGRIW